MSAPTFSETHPGSKVVVCYACMRDIVGILVRPWGTQPKHGVCHVCHGERESENLLAEVKPSSLTLVYDARGRWAKDGKL